MANEEELVEALREFVWEMTFNTNLSGYETIAIINKIGKEKGKFVKRMKGRQYQFEQELKELAGV